MLYIFANSVEGHIDEEKYSDAHTKNLRISRLNNNTTRVECAFTAIAHIVVIGNICLDVPTFEDNDCCNSDESSAACSMQQYAAAQTNMFSFKIDKLYKSQQSIKHADLVAR